MAKKIISYSRYFLVVALVGALVLTLFPGTLGGGQAENIQSFVTRFYVQCLNRQPDSNGLNEWVSRLMNGSKTGADVAEGFVFSKEFLSHGHSDEEFVNILYRAFFNREPDANGYNAWLGRLKGGMSREKVLDGFLKSKELQHYVQITGLRHMRAQLPLLRVLPLLIRHHLPVIIPAA